MFPVALAALSQVLLQAGGAIAAFQQTLPPFPPLYSSSFVEPTAPIVTAEFRANYMQHKYNNDSISNIVAGFAYISPSQAKSRFDIAADGTLGASIFDFANTTADGLVANTILTLGGALTAPNCSSFFVAPFMPLFAPDFLRTSAAVYAGAVQDDLYGFVSAWQLLFAGIPVSVYLDANNTLVRFDFAAPGPLRTFATTRFFNIIPGAVDPAVFETPCA